jgi:hypothetical protein
MSGPLVPHGSCGDMTQFPIHGRDEFPGRVPITRAQLPQQARYISVV